MKPLVTIIISNYNSLHWLRFAVHQIRKHTKIPYHILVSEQSEDHFPVQAEYNGWDILTVVPMEGHSSGFGTDYILKNIPIESPYICSMDVDTFPISDDWLTVPIELLGTYGLTWVGLRAEIESAYGLYYFHMGECYRIGRTEDFMNLSINMGFYQRKGEDFRDNAVMAHSWEDANFKHKKLSLPVTGRIGVTRSEGEYGRVIGNLAMHFCFAFTSTLHKTPVKNMGEDYMAWEEKIKTLPPEELLDQIMGAVKYSNRLQPLQYWDGEIHNTPPKELVRDVRRKIMQYGSFGIDIFREGVEVRGVIHIGANVGREYLEYSENFVENVMFFEPDPSYFNRLIEEMPDRYDCYRMVLSDYNGTITLNSDPGIGVLTPVSALDDIDFDRSQYNIMVVSGDMDTAAFRKGAEKTLKNMDMIVTLYK